MIIHIYGNLITIKNLTKRYEIKRIDDVHTASSEKELQNAFLRCNAKWKNIIKRGDYMNQKEFFEELERIMELPFRPEATKIQVIISVCDALKFADLYKFNVFNICTNPNIKTLNFKTNGFYIWILSMLAHQLGCEASILSNKNIRSNDASFNIYGNRLDITILSIISKPLAYYLDKEILKLKMNRYKGVPKVDFRIEKRQFYYDFAESLSKQFLVAKVPCSIMSDAVIDLVNKSTNPGKYQAHPSFPYKTHDLDLVEELQ